MRCVWWFLPRRTFPDRGDPTFQGWAFFWKPSVVLGVTVVVYLPFQKTSTGRVLLLVGMIVFCWLAIIGLVDLVRYLLLPRPRRGRGHG